MVKMRVNPWQSHRQVMYMVSKTKIGQSQMENRYEKLSSKTKYEILDLRVSDLIKITPSGTYFYI
jgi:hypothetical protein